MVYHGLFLAIFLGLSQSKMGYLGLAQAISEYLRMINIVGVCASTHHLGGQLDRVDGGDRGVAGGFYHLF